ncbi:MAG: threonylcarbamoyl-AMP synthase [Chloroflexi bacterium]|nr:MAG: threonylcarbamoyl-AMP synthase [Chloroflexota bacterium]
MIERLPATPEGLAAAAALLDKSGLAAFPTDTVYGIGCRVGDVQAVARIFAAKRRPTERQVPILAASLEQAAELGYRVDDRVQRLASRWWPGPLTIVLRVEDGAGATPSMAVTQAFRVPDHRVALSLIERSGPLATSSANRSGEPETYDADDVLVAFADDDLLDAVVDGGRVPGGVASTVVDLSETQPRLVREGPITRKQLMEVIGRID